MTVSADDEVGKALESLESLTEEHYAVGRDMTNAHGGGLYGFDLLAYAVLNRSVAQIRGFCHLIREKNILCAGALLRLQLDTLIRFYAAWLVEDPHEFAMRVLEGTRVRDLRDRDGKRMVDAHLVEQLGNDFHWVPAVYERSSGYVHLSAVHVHAAVFADLDTPDEGVIHMKVSGEDRALPDELYVEAISAFQAATRALLDFVNGWAYTKANPELAKKMRNEQLGRGDA
jgi:hypothetical protein